MFLIPIIVVVSFLVWANFSPGSWLSGWDNLHPEFYLALNIKRSIFAVWQEYQGLGLIGGMGYASDLPRQLFILLLNNFFPGNWLRQLYFFLMLLLGPLGVYFLLSKIVIKQKFVSLMGALFYLLNLATIQTFYTPFSSFVTHFAFLPWLFLTAFLYLKKPTFKTGVFFLLVNIAAIPQGYVPTVFFVYFGALFVSLAVYSRLEKMGWKRPLKIIFATLFINAFWLLPFLFFTLTNAQVTVDSKINQMTTENYFLQNKQFGTLLDVPLLKGFWFAYTDYDKSGNLTYLLGNWRNHLMNPFVAAIGYFFFAIVISGIVYVFRSKNPFRYPLLLLFLLSFTFLASGTPPFSWIDGFLYRFPFISQALRSPFTKFSILAAFSYSIFFAFGLLWLKKLNLKLQSLIFSLLGLLLIIFVLPAFNGNLFYNNLKVNIPSEYQSLREYFQTQNPNTRIANFPQFTFWGWNFYRWGYDGSGFQWYGIEQPILDRAFDVWSSKDENYYWEVSYALYSKNLDLFEKVLEKYQINWLLVDQNVINLSSPKALYFNELQEMIAKSSKISLSQSFGKIDLYKVDLKTPVNNFVYALESPQVIEPSYKWSNFDQAYMENSNYVINSTTSNQQSAIYYPFRTLFTGKAQNDLEFIAEEKDNYFILKKEVPSNLENYSLLIPQKTEELPQVSSLNLRNFQYLEPEVSFEENFLVVKFPTIGGRFSASIDPTNDPGIMTPVNCNKFTNGPVRNEIENGILRSIAKNADICSTAFWLPNLPHNLSYLISIESKNVAGQSLVFWLENPVSRKSDLETLLPRGSNSDLAKSYFIQPPMETDGLGYTLHFDTHSIGQEESINELGQINIQPIPYKFLSNIKLVPNGYIPPQTQLINVSEVNHPNSSIYVIPQLAISNQQSAIIVLSQSFNNGWHAYQTSKSIPSFLAPIFGTGVGEHALVNNWSNGWSLNNISSQSNQKIVIIYLPQYLEFLGFFLLFVSIVWIVRRKTT